MAQSLGTNLALRSAAQRTDTVPTNRRRALRSLVPYLYVLPAVVLLGLIYLYPIARVINDSLYRWTGGSPVWIGLRNYVQLLTTASDVKTAFLNNIRLLAAVPIILVLSVLIAYIFHQEVFAGRVYQTLVFLPTVISVVVVGILFSYLLAPSGFVNTFLRTVGLTFLARNWLGDTHLAIYACLAVIVWKELGFGIMLFRARLSSLDPELFDAGRVDGANSVQLLWHIVVPQLRGIIQFFLVYYSIIIFSSVFGYIFVMTYGGPAKSTTVIDFEIYQYAFLRNSRGEASALAFMLLLGTSVLIYLQYRLRRASEEDQV